MNGTLSAVLVTASLVLAVLAAVWTARDRSTGRVLVGGAGLVEVLVLVQLVVGVLALPHRGVSAALFVGYLVGTAVVLPAAVAWARAEPGRWGAGVLLIAALVVPVLVARLHMVWDGRG
ncbi:hypothetical protein [Angustibacter aerolatus]